MDATIAEKILGAQAGNGPVKAGSVAVASVDFAMVHDACAFADERDAMLYDVGDGICHQVLPEGRHFTGGDLVVGTDTQSTTYGALCAVRDLLHICSRPLGRANRDRGRIEFPFVSFVRWRLR